ncbi:MAG: hypothetical protein HC819_24850 [Cyclobacteriaceae bacterium]|nr:hypothetical protein [Cyclobacteriaceae bacterium]
MKKLMLMISSVVMLSSCALHGGYMSDSASLSDANFNYVKQNLRGEAKASYFLGFGGLKKETLLKEAKDNMMQGLELKANQTLANITVNWKLNNYIVASSNTCIVTADIVEFK